MESEKTGLEKKEPKESKQAEAKSSEAKTPVGVLERVRAEGEVFKSKLQEDIDAIKEPQKTQLWKSIFRVKHDETPRSRSLGVLSNVFLHLHPASRPKVKYFLGFSEHCMSIPNIGSPILLVPIVKSSQCSKA